MFEKRNSLEMGSSDDLDFILENEKRYGIAITDAETQAVETFGGWFDLMKVKTNRPNEEVGGPLWDELVQLVRSLGWSWPETITPDTTFF